MHTFVIFCVFLTPKIAFTNIVRLNGLLSNEMLNNVKVCSIFGITLKKLLLVEANEYLVDRLQKLLMVTETVIYRHHIFIIIRVVILSTVGRKISRDEHGA